MIGPYKKLILVSLAFFISTCSGNVSIDPCPGGTMVDGGCVPGLCGDRMCADGFQCQDSICVEVVCIGVSCESGQVCAGGQ